MDPLNIALEGFAPELYLATLVEVARADGLQAVERDFLEQQASNFGITLDKLPPVSQDLSHLPWTTRVLVYRDALMLAYADSEELSPEEKVYLDGLTERLMIPQEKARTIEQWLKEYSALIERFGAITDAEP